MCGTKPTRKTPMLPRTLHPVAIVIAARIGALGWQPKLTIREGIVRTVQWLSQNRWVMDPP